MSEISEISSVESATAILAESVWAEFMTTSPKNPKIKNAFFIFIVYWL